MIGRPRLYDNCTVEGCVGSHWAKALCKIHYVRMTRTPEMNKVYNSAQRDRQYHRKRTVELKEAIYDELGRKCKVCGFKDIRALQIDHINDDGAKERKELRSSTRMYRRVIEDTDNRYQILCANCNFIKKQDNVIKKYGVIRGSGN